MNLPDTPAIHMQKNINKQNQRRWQITVFSRYNKCKTICTVYFLYSFKSVQFLYFMYFSVLFIGYLFPFVVYH